MEYIRLGNTGLKVSKLCLGTMTYAEPSEQWPWALGQEKSRPFIKKALELGINFFDTADVYGNGTSEEIVGGALKDYAKREDVVIASKVFGSVQEGVNRMGLSRKHIMHAIDDSLERLGTDYIDLYQIHRWDYDTPIEETMQALHDVVKSGKARYIGASSMYAWQFAKAQNIAEKNGWTKFVSMQPHYNLVYREEEREMFPLCEDQNIAVIPWSPLARGLLTKKADQRNASQRSQSDAFGDSMYGNYTDFEIADRVSEIAEKRDVPNAQIALAWMLSKKAITSPIIGATKLKYLEDAVGALSIQLLPDEIQYLEELYQPHEVLGFK